jgi:fermentation-respiration switch protein FrsA (DUF1100 family)
VSVAGPILRGRPGLASLSGSQSGIATLRSMLRKLALSTAVLTAPGVGMTLLSERLMRPHLFYTGEWNPDPPDAVGHPYEEATLFTSDSLELQGWFFKAPFRDGRPAPTILFFHGTSYNASDMWVSDERAEGFDGFLNGTRCNFFVFDYRGYGRSPGVATERGTYTDAAAALAWLYGREDVDPATVFFYGFSLGAGIACEMAMREPSAGLILRAAFTSMRDMIIDWDRRFRYALALAPWLPITKYDNLSKIRRLDRPLLIMHGDADNTVPEAMGQRLLDAAPEPKRYVVCPGAGHRDISNEFVVPAVSGFVEDVVSGALIPATAAPASAAIASAAG